MACPRRDASGVLPMTMLILNGVATPACWSRDLAWLGSCGGHAWAASEEKGLDGLIGLQVGVKRPLNTTWLRAARSILSSNACRTFGSVAIALAYGACSGAAGLPTPLTLPTLMV